MGEEAGSSGVVGVGVAMAVSARHNGKRTVLRYMLANSRYDVQKNADQNLLRHSCAWIYITLAMRCRSGVRGKLVLEVDRLYGKIVNQGCTPLDILLLLAFEP